MSDDEFDSPPPHAPLAERTKFQDAIKELRKNVRMHEEIRQAGLLYSALADAAEKMERHAYLFRDESIKLPHVLDARDVEALYYLAAHRAVQNITFKDKTWEAVMEQPVEAIHNYLTTYYQDVLDQGKALAA